MKGLTLPKNLARGGDSQSWYDVTVPASVAVTIALRLLHYWGVPDLDWAPILGVSPERLTEYRAGGYPTATPELQRLEDLLVMHKALTVMFPDEHVCRSWCASRNRAFGDPRR